MKGLSIIMVCFVAVSVIVWTGATADAAQGAHLFREGFFKEITNTEASGFEIYSFRASGDGSRIAYFGWDGSNHSLWRVDSDGQNNTMIEQTFEWMSLYNGLYDISDDGSTIAYIRKTSAADNTPEITVYDVGTGTKTQVLKLLPVSNWGTPEMWHFDPQDTDRLFRLSGDGSTVVFLNRFGPFSGGAPTSGFTYYSVQTDGGGFSTCLQTIDIPSISGIGTDSVSLVPWTGELAISEDGSFLAIVTAGSWGDTDLVTMDANGANAKVIQDVRAGNFYGPAMSGDGSKIVYAKGGTGLPESDGVFVTNPGLPQSPVQIAPESGYWSVFPEISTDGDHVVFNFDLGGGSSPSIRLARSDGTRRLPITEPMVEAKGTQSMVAAGGKTIFMVATTDRWGYPELVRFDLDVSPFLNMPRVTAVSGDPDMSIAEGGGPHTFFYYTLGGPPTEMYSMPFTQNPGELSFPGFSGFETWGYLLDDGSTQGDATAGDGVFTDSSVQLTQPPPDGLEFFTVRAGLVTDVGVAAFADYSCSFGERHIVILADGFESGGLDGW